jgi:hypothetical protein
MGLVDSLIVGRRLSRRVAPALEAGLSRGSRPAACCGAREAGRWFFELAAEHFRRDTSKALLADLAIVAAGEGDRGGTHGVVRELVVLRSLATAYLSPAGRPVYPVIALFDNDTVGQKPVNGARARRIHDPARRAHRRRHSSHAPASSSAARRSNAAARLPAMAASGDRITTQGNYPRPPQCCRRPSEAEQLPACEERGLPRRRRRPRARRSFSASDGKSAGSRGGGLGASSLVLAPAYQRSSPARQGNIGRETHCLTLWGRQAHDRCGRRLSMGRVLGVATALFISASGRGSAFQTVAFLKHGGVKASRLFTS